MDNGKTTRLQDGQRKKLGYRMDNGKKLGYRMDNGKKLRYRMDNGKN
jgi:hypothetical protein